MYKENIIRRRKVTYFVVVFLLIIWLVYKFLLSGNVDDDLGYVMPGTRYRDFNGFDSWEYYLYFFENKYAGYPWVVKVSFCVVVSAVILWLVAFISLGVYAYKKFIRRRIYTKLCELYYENLKKVMTTEEDLSLLMVNQILDLQRRSFSNVTYKLWFKLFRAIHVECGKTISINNTINAAEVIGMMKYATEELSRGKIKEKIRLLQSIRQLCLPLPPGLLSRLINDNNERLRKQSRLYYCATNPEDPYIVFNEDFFNEHFYVWDEMELHDTAEFFIKRHRKMPSFVPLINDTKYPSIKSFLIREVGYWGEEGEVKEIMKFFDSKNMGCREAAYECMGYYKYEPSEKSMMKRYLEEKDDAQRKILISVLKINSGKAEDFLKRACMTAESAFSKRVALFCLLNYSEKGKRYFYEMEKEAQSDERRTFQHVEDPIINNAMLKQR